MKIAPLPDDEEARLAALRGHHILDTPPEESFNDLTTLAADICGTPIALVSLVDEHRQWFKSKVGIDTTEISRDIAFCAHAIHGENLFVVPDTTDDERFADNPLVTAYPNIRFYAGMPLVSPGGYAMGTLCVLDRVPRHLTNAQQDALRRLGRQVVNMILFSHYKQQEQALRTSRKHYQILFESSRDAIMTLAPPLWRFTSWNPATVQMFKAQDEAEFISLGPWELSPERQPDGRLSSDKAREMIETAMREGSHFFEWTHRRRTGQVFPATVLLTRMDIDGQPQLQATVRDISEQHNADELLQAATRAVMRLFLKDTPHIIEEAENGSIALQKFQEGSYDLVLMDMQMPVMDGLMATAAIRAWEQDHQQAPTPIIALTANVLKEDLNKSLAAGCVAHVTKPVRKKTLLAAIDQYATPPSDLAA